MYVRFIAINTNIHSFLFLLLALMHLKQCYTDIYKMYIFRLGENTAFLYFRFKSFIQFR